MKHRLTELLILMTLTVIASMAAGCGSAAEPRQDIQAEPNTLSQPAAPPASDAAGRGRAAGDTAGSAEPGAGDPSHTLGRESPPFIGSLERSGETGAGAKSAGSMTAPEKQTAGGDGPDGPTGP